MSQSDRFDPYAPPAAALADAQDGEAPALWNPNAVTNWSVLFTPVFGSLLVYLNWKALGKEKEATTAQVLFYVSIAVLAMSIVLNWRGLALPWLIGWYVAAGRPQAKYVREHFGKNYPRKAWGKPLGLALLATVGLVVALVAFVIITK